MKTGKKILSMFLVVLMVLTCVPLSGFVGIDLSKFSIIASAVEDEEYNVIDINMYKAQCMLGIASGENENNIYKCSTMYKTYTHNNTYSPSQNYLDLCYNDASFMSEYNSWKAYAFLADPSEALSNSSLDMIMKKEDYYESLIISMYYKAIAENSELQKLLESSIIKHTNEIIDQLCEIAAISETSQILEAISTPDPKTIKMLEECVKSTYSLSIASDICGVVDDVISYGSDIVDVVNRITIYGSMLQLDNATKDWINQMYNFCTESTSFPLKSALKSLSLASTDYAGAVLADIKTSAFTFINWSLKETIDAGISTVASLNPVFGAVFAGLKLGKTICNIFFGTDDVCEQMFMMECIYEVQDLARQVVISKENTFKNKQTTDNARSFTYAVDCYFESIINIDIDCMETFLDKLYNGGIIKGSSFDYQEHIEYLENLRASRANNYNDMNDYFRLALKDNYPSIYEFYFVEDGTIPIKSISIYVQCMMPIGYPLYYTNLFVDQTEFAQIEIYPKNTTQRDYIIKSDNPDVVRVDGDKLTGVSEGTANVAVISVDNPYCFDVQKVTVKEKKLEEGEGAESGEGTAGLLATVDSNTKAATIIGIIDNTVEEITIPSRYNGYTVNSIGEGAFVNCVNLESVVLPNTVEVIGKGAFYNCENLETINFPNSLKKIEKAAFYNCTLLTFGTDWKVDSIGEIAFYNCDSISKFSINQTNSLEAGALSNCNSLFTVKSSYSLATAVGESLYFPNITISDGVIVIDNCGYYGWSYLCSITIPNDVRTIGTMAFESTQLNHIFYTGTQSQWNSINMYSNNQRIRKATKHYNADNTNNVVISSSIEPTCENQGYETISCAICDEEICTIRIPSIDHIGVKVKTVEPSCTLDKGYTLYQCKICSQYYKKDFTEPPGHIFKSGYCSVCGVPEYLSYRLNNNELEIDGLKTEQLEVYVPNRIENYTVKHISHNAFRDSSIRDITLPNCISTIGQYSFSGCNNLESITIPDGVCEIGTSTFYGCTSLKYLNTGNGISSFKGIPLENLEKIVLGNKITNIEKNTFRNCTNLRWISFGNKLESIGTSAFSGCKNLMSITIPYSVSSLGNYAFDDCVNLTSIYYDAKNIELTESNYNIFANAGTANSGISVYIGNEVENIPVNIFWSYDSYQKPSFTSPKISYVSIGKNVKTIGNGAFARCKDLNKVDFLCENLTVIDGSAFEGCSGLSDITIPNSVISIGDYAFRGCDSLTSVTIPDSVTSIGDSAFRGCTSLTNTTIGNSVTSIGSSAFEDCTSLTSVTIGNGVTSIGNYAFSGCSKLTSVTIPDSVTSIGNSAFSCCTSLTSITIGKGVTSIGEKAFNGCNKLSAVFITDIAVWCKISFSAPYSNYSANPLYYAKKLYLNGELVTDLVIPDGTTSINSYAFYYCTSLTSVTIPDSVTSIGNCAFYYCTSLTSVTIPDSVTSIGNCAFYYCTSLTSVTIPDSVTSVGQRAFSGCDKLSDVYISDVAAWCNISFSSSSSNPLCYAESLYLNGKLLTNLVIPDGVTNINKYAFYNCESITSVTIPDSVTSIGDYAFDYCYNLTSITIPDSVTSIGNYAFYNCTSLTSITIPDSVTSIGNSAFSSCWKLTSVTIPDSVTSIGDYAFRYCDSLTGITVDSENTKYSSDSYGVLFNEDKTELIQYPTGNKRTSYSIPDSVTIIDDYAFRYCDNLTSVTIPDSVTSIGNYAFYNCTSLTSITIPDSVTSIGNSAFSSCWKLTSVTIPDSVTSIGDYAFRYCDSLTGITVDSENTKYSSDSYGVLFNKDKTELIQYPVGNKRTSYSIPDSVTSIGNSAFDGCTNLTSITIPDSVTSIGNSAFYGCTSLTSVTIGGSVTSIGRSAFEDCTNLTDVYYTGSQPQWNKIKIGSNNTKLTGANIQLNHIHSHTATVIKSPTCTDSGTALYTCVCGDTYTDTLPATGHTFDGSECINCGYDRANECSCNCHASGIAHFFFVIVNFFQKLFGNNKVCACGAKH